MRGAQRNGLTSELRLSSPKAQSHPRSGSGLWGEAARGPKGCLGPGGRWTGQPLALPAPFILGRNLAQEIACIWLSEAPLSPWKEVIPKPPSSVLGLLKRKGPRAHTGHYGSWRGMGEGGTAGRQISPSECLCR